MEPKHEGAVSQRSKWQALRVQGVGTKLGDNQARSSHGGQLEAILSRALGGGGGGGGGHCETGR